ncbi:hypothetical protein ACEWY4_005302 [Coilia grayii]|uniref:Interferon alpha-inducible protein 27-like protein 2A n=1 Tax=Coilia grayii TaxID=363190 RepID=A0ABD1KIB2_9TELE
MIIPWTAQCVRVPYKYSISPRRGCFASSRHKDNDMGLLTIAAAVAGGAGAVATAPLLLTAVGFTAGGIAAGSIASSMMSAAAVANGGGVAAGGLVALLQSAGVVGLSGGATAAVAGTGASAAAAAAAILI